MKGLLIAGLIFGVFAFAGCNDCGGLWFQDCPDPSPSPIPAPSPSPAPLGTVIASWPSAVAKSFGSVDFRDGELVEYCRGAAKLFFREITTGDVKRVEDLNAKLNSLWAVCWDPGRKCYWGSNPERKGYDLNMVQISEAGAKIGGDKMMGGTENSPLIIYDLEYNADYSYTDSSGNKIVPGLIESKDWHYSLRKIDFITTEKVPYWEQYWWCCPIQFKAATRVGNKYWAACDDTKAVGGQYPIYEYRQGYRKERIDKGTGRQIVVPGVWFCSLKYRAGLLWGKGINAKTGESRIYAISLGQ